MAGLDNVKKKIILVDDNYEVKFLLSSILENSGYETISAPDSLCVQKMVIDLKPDLVITDAVMPKRDGFELCYLIKKDERTSHVPVLMVTSLPVKYSTLAERALADSYLSKPFTPKSLLEAVRTTLKET